MKTKKKLTFIYEGLGVPVKLINAPMKKMLGEWCLDINMETLQRVVLEAIVHKPTALTGDELRYIPLYGVISKGLWEAFWSESCRCSEMGK